MTFVKEKQSFNITEEMCFSHLQHLNYNDALVSLKQ